MALAAVQTDRRKLEFKEFALPKIGADDALLKIEACGICGTDYEQYNGDLRFIRYPVIPGHEPVGVIAEIGEEAARRWGVTKGDRVAVEPILPCGRCSVCLTGHYQRCIGLGRGGYGTRTADRPPYLWGGFAQYMYLHPNSVVHKMSRNLPAELAVLFNPLANGLRWAHSLPGTGIGDTVVILGPGQRGLCAVIAAREAGAGQIIVTGLASDAAKLELARELGAHHTINVEAEDPVKKVREITGNRRADVVLDVTAYATKPVADALDLVRPGGTIILAGLKGGKPVPEFVSDKVVMREITIRGALAADYDSYARAVRLLESGKYPFAGLHTHTFPLGRAEEAIRTLARELPGDPIHIAVVPET
jgi:threonine dehydrogenase-like Zn-dependent dehydrogenase